MDTTYFDFTVVNHYNQDVVVFSTFDQTASTPPSQSADDYLPVYTSLGKVAQGQTVSFPSTLLASRIVVARASDQFPLTVKFMQFDDPPDGLTLTVTSDDEHLCQSAFSVYKRVMSQSFDPFSLQFNDILINTDILSLDTAVSAYLNANGYPGVGMVHFTAVSYWATYTLYAFPGTYYVYAPQSNNGTSHFILPTVPIGTIAIQNGTAAFQSASGGAPMALTQSRSQLTSANASPPGAGLSMVAIVRDLTWESQPEEIVCCYSGTLNGQQIIAQPYQNPPLPWWVIAYDLAYGGFELVQCYMMYDMAKSILSGLKDGGEWLSENRGDLRGGIRKWCNEQGDQANPTSEAGPDADPINVDTDVDVDVDVDVDTDVDIDTEIDVDIDIDVDVDFFAVVDVDVDVDIDVDVVTDTDVVTDVDVDTDIDTDINAPEGMAKTLLRGLGNWLLKKGLPMLTEMLEIQIAMTTAQQLLGIWEKAGTSDINSLQPRESSGLGLLLNYLLNPANPVATRWNTFADYAQQSSADSTSLQTVVASVLVIKNDAADQDSNNWRWSADDENALVNTLAAFTGDQTYKAFQTLGAYTYKGSALPIKVGCQVAVKYLKKIA